MHNSKTCCLEQSDGQNFPLLSSQSNAEKSHMITEKSNSPKYRTTGIYGEAILIVPTAIISWKPRKIAMTSTNQHRRNESSDAFPARNHERCSKLTHFHALTFFYLPPLLPNTSSMITVDCRFLGISVIT